MDWVQGVKLASTRVPWVPVAGHRRLDTELSVDGILLAFVDRLASKWVLCSAHRISSRFTCPLSIVIRVARSLCSGFVLVHSILKRYGDRNGDMQMTSKT